jgi:hypothetical protein
MPILFTLSLLLVVFGMMCLFAAYRLRYVIRPTGAIDYVDDTYEVSVPRGPMVDARLGLTGQPDTLIQVLKTGEMIPVRSINTPAPTAISAPHYYEITALCLLVERIYSKTPPYGVLRYTNEDVTIEWKSEMAQQLESLTQSMRADSLVADVPRSHDNPSARPVLRTLCDQRL